MQTVLGAGGAIGKELAKCLKDYTNDIRLVSRTPSKVADDNELVAADLLDAKAVSNAVQGSDVVYLVAGLPYRLKIWKTQWPQVMENVIDACKQHNARLVFFDNVYCYGKESMGNMTEESHINPCSKKGAIRAQVAQMILDEIKDGGLTAMIVRSADFYGPGIDTSPLMETVYKNLKKGKPAIVLGRPDVVRSVTYTPDAAKATALLGNTIDAFNQVWHLPTDKEKISGNDWVALFAEAMQLTPKHMAMPAWAIKMIGIFNPMMKEVAEMMYQYDRDYFFNSEKFQKRFPQFVVTSYKDGVKKVIDFDKAKVEI